MIDILVYMETLKGRRVYLDYTKNPGNGIDFEKLPKEAKEYLERGNACFGTPYDRLMQMNEPAVSFFRDKGVDLKHERLEIALCAQHNNGGLSIDAWWQTNIKGLFCIGEAAASHGIYRPGGTALNAGQVGALRAAQYISQQPVKVPVEPEALFYRDKDQIASILSMTEKVLDGQNSNVIEQITAAQIRMSHTGSAFRDLSTMRKTLSSVEEELSELTETCHVKEVSQLHNFFTLRDILLAQKTYLHAMIDYADVNGHSRGSALYHDPSGTKPAPDFPENFRFTLEDDPCKSAIQEIKYRGQHPIITWRAPRPIPDDDDFFENVWKHYRQNKNVY